MGFSHNKSFPYYVLQLFLLVCFCFFIFAESIDTINANEYLRDSESLISNGKRFKLSFFSPANSSRRYVGIMFNLPVMTVVWVANRNKPLNDSTATLEMSSDGNLVILDGRKEIVWSTNLSTPVANASAVLLDTGNLVVRDNSNNAYVWESFKHASDSWLEKMTIYTDLNRSEKNMLTSWRSPDDPATGSFTFTIEPDLGIPQLFIRKDDHPYLRSGPIKSVNGDGLLNVSGDSPRTAYATFLLPNPSILEYSVLNSSGNLEDKKWSDEKKVWEVITSSWVIENKCDLYGVCGPFGICNRKSRPMCSCFPGFMPASFDEWVTGNWTSGCTRKTVFQCQEYNPFSKQDEFEKVKMEKLPDHFTLRGDPSFEGDCRGTCLINCSCIAYADSSEFGCLHWTGNLTDAQGLSNGDYDRGGGGGGVGDLYIRLVSSSAVLGNSKQGRRTIFVTTVVLKFTFFSVCICFLSRKLLNYRARKHKNQTDAGDSEEIMLIQKGVKLEELPIFKFQMLSIATNNFDPVNKLGQGGFGLVYKGKLPNGQEIAVKRLARSSNQGVEEFMNEVEVISKLQHRNLVRLLGCCIESEEKMLVYEYMNNGSLDTYLFNTHKRDLVDWKTCKLIIEGICRGLLYLHRDSRLKIIHRDLKASNILLDEELNPKISDFGLARIFCGNDHQANTRRVAGTYGYMPPEYVLHGMFSEKSDVYSFGVLLLEIVSGRKNSSFYEEDQQLFLVAYAWKLWNEGKIVNLMDPALYNAGIESDIVRYANVGLLCVQEVAADRPNISTVLSMLSYEIVELPRPHQPAYLGTQMSSAKSSSKCSSNDVTISVLEGR